MKIKQIMAAALAAILLASCSATKQTDKTGIAGTETENTPSETQSKPDETAPAETENTTAAKTDGELTVQEALQAALADAGMKENEAMITKKGMDTEPGMKKYEFEFHKGTDEYEYEINAKDGSIISFEAGIWREPAGIEGIISVDEALAEGLEDTGRNIEEFDSWSADLDDEHGVLHYDVSFEAGRTEYSYEIDPYSGAITLSEIETD